MIELPLSQGKIGIIDDIDADLAEMKWCFRATRDPDKGYVHRSLMIRCGSYKAIVMHRVILERSINRPLKKGEYVDHINGNSLDNRRENLRLATNSQNSCNKGAQANNACGVKGVDWHPISNKWRAAITTNGKKIHLGTFVDINDAAHAYNNAALLYHGEFARLNPIGGMK